MSCDSQNLPTSYQLPPGCTASGQPWARVGWSGSPSERGFSECFLPSSPPGPSHSWHLLFSSMPFLHLLLFSPPPPPPHFQRSETLDLFPACFVMQGSKNFRVFPL